ncbi:MAG: YncE family protein [Gammaproteobacteria bacterium]
MRARSAVLGKLTGGWLGALLALLILVATPAHASTPTPFAYVANAGEGTVSVVNTASNAVVATVPYPGALPESVAAAPDGKFVYVGSHAFGVAAIDTSTNTVAWQIEAGNTPGRIGGLPTGLAISPDGQFLYVSLQITDAVAVVDTATHTVVHTIPVGVCPVGIDVSPDGSRVYVANVCEASNNVSVIDTASDAVVATILTSNDPWDVAVSPNGNYAYVTGASSDVEISTSSNAVTALLPTTYAGGLAFTPDGLEAYLFGGPPGEGANPGVSLSVLSTATRVFKTVLSTGNESPRDIATTPDGKFAYFTSQDKDSLTVVNTANHLIVGSVPVGDQPVGVAITPPIEGPPAPPTEEQQPPPPSPAPAPPVTSAPAATPTQHHQAKKKRKRPRRCRKGSKKRKAHGKHRCTKGGKHRHRHKHRHGRRHKAKHLSTFARSSDLRVQTVPATTAGATASRRHRYLRGRRPRVFWTLPGGVNEGQPIPFSWKVAGRLGRKYRLVVQRPVGTGHVWQTMQRLRGRRGSAELPGQALGTYRFRLAVLEGRRVLAQRVTGVGVFGQVPFSVLFSNGLPGTTFGHQENGVYATSSTSFPYIGGVWAGDRGTPNTAFSIRSNPCVSVHIAFVLGETPGEGYTYPADVFAVVSLVQQTRDPVATEVPLNGTGSIDAELVPGQTWSLLAVENDRNGVEAGPTVYFNGYAVCDSTGSLL